MTVHRTLGLAEAPWRKNRQQIGVGEDAIAAICGICGAGPPAIGR